MSSLRTRLSATLDAADRPLMAASRRGTRALKGMDAYLADLDRVPVRSEAEQDVIAERALQGDLEAQQELVLANLRFAIAQAKKYVWRRNPDTILDAIQDANLALVRAIGHFDPTLDVNFRSYANAIIRNMVREGVLRREATMSAPDARLSEARKRARGLPAHHASAAPDSSPAPTPVATRPVSAKKALQFENAAKAAATKKAQTARDVELLGAEVVALEAPAFAESEKGPKVQDIVAGPDDPARDLEREETQAAVLAGLEALPPRLRQVLVLAHGLEGDAPLLDKEIAEQLGVGRSRVQQLRTQAEAALAAQPSVRRALPTTTH